MSASKDHPATAWPDAAVAAFRDVLGWTVVVEGSDLVVRVGEVCHAIVMPTSVADAARAELAAVFQPSPTISDASGRTCTLLASPIRSGRPRACADLEIAGVHHLPEGAPLLLPPLSPHVDPAGSRWFEEPVRDGLPAWTAVVGATRRALARSRSSGTARVQAPTNPTPERPREAS